MKKKYLFLTMLFLAIGFASVAVTLFVNETIKDSANTEKITVNATEGDSKGIGTLASTVDGKLYTLIADANDNGIADIGDEIQVKGTNENFYVISNDGDTLNALAKYNLNVGNMCTNFWSCTPIENPTGLQDESMTGYKNISYGNGSVTFSNNNGWSYENNDDIDIQSYDGPVKSAINAYKEYLPEGINVRLITKTELDGVGCDSSGNSCFEAPTWVYSTSYWTGSATSKSASGVWFVNSGRAFGIIAFNNDSFYGVRPVISLES